MKQLLLTALCTFCTMEPMIIKAKKPKPKYDPYYGMGRKPDLVSVRAKIEDYYKYDKKTKKLVYKE